MDVLGFVDSLFDYIFSWIKLDLLVGVETI